MQTHTVYLEDLPPLPPFKYEDQISDIQEVTFLICEILSSNSLNREFIQSLNYPDFRDSRKLVDLLRHVEDIVVELAEDKMICVSEDVIDILNGNYAKVLRLPKDSNLYRTLLYDWYGQNSFDDLFALTSMKRHINCFYENEDAIYFINNPYFIGLNQSLLGITSPASEHLKQKLQMEIEKVKNTVKDNPKNMWNVQRAFRDVVTLVKDYQLQTDSHEILDETIFTLEMENIYRWDNLQQRLNRDLEWCNDEKDEPKIKTRLKDSEDNMMPEAYIKLDDDNKIQSVEYADFLKLVAQVKKWLN